MYTQVARPEKLTPEELDRYLARGWYRTGQVLFTCRFTFYDGVLRPTIWTRVPLAGYTFRRGLRRLMRRNERSFDSTVGPVRLDETHEALYQRYCASVRGRRPESLEDLLTGGIAGDLFDTRQIEVWAGDRLVAFSLFDVGRKAVESITGVYDPDFAWASLGFYTMLLELRWSLEAGIELYYPGYVMPGEPVMDYKLRLGHLEHFEPELQRWRPIGVLPQYEMPTDRMRRALDAVHAVLTEAGIRARVMEYPAYDLGAWNPHIAGFVDHPLVLVCARTRGSEPLQVVTFNLDTERFELLRCVPAVLRSADGATTSGLLFIEERRARRATAEEIAEELSRIR